MYNNLVTYNHYAQLRNVVQQTVRKWAAENKIKTVRIDGRLFVVLSKKEMEEFKIK